MHCNCFLTSLWRHKFWKWSIFLIKSFFLHDQNVETKIQISREWKELLRWNKKHFSSFLKSFNWSKQKNLLGVGESPPLSMIVSKEFYKKKVNVTFCFHNYLWPFKRNYKWDKTLITLFPVLQKKSKNKNSNQFFCLVENLGGQG